MIHVYPIEIEAVDDDLEPVFKLRSFDESCATLTVNYVVSPGTVDELCAALQKAVQLLELTPSASAPVQARIVADTDDDDDEATLVTLDRHPGWEAA